LRVRLPPPAPDTLQNLQGTCLKKPSLYAT